MAIIIDISAHRPTTEATAASDPTPQMCDSSKEIHVYTSSEVGSPCKCGARKLEVSNVERRDVTLQEQPYDACKHWSMKIDDNQRTVKCGDCDIWLDPVWCLRELFHYYERRIDQRVQDIAEFDRKQREAAERLDKRQRQPRAAMIERRAASAERAAYNEYQAKVLQARAERQRALVAKLDIAISRDESAMTADAVDPQVGSTGKPSTRD